MTKAVRSLEYEMHFHLIRRFILEICGLTKHIEEEDMADS